MKVTCSQCFVRVFADFICFLRFPLFPRAESVKYLPEPTPGPECKIGSTSARENKEHMRGVGLTVTREKKEEKERERGREQDSTDS